MDFDISWSDVGNLLTKAAPIAAGILTGGSSTAITAVAGLIASELGCDPSPAAIQAAVQADPQAPLKLAELELNHRRDMQALAIQARSNELAAETARLGKINDTMQTESQSDKWWVSGWRPYWGFISGTAFAFVAALVCWLGFNAVSSGNQEAMRMVPDLVSAMALLFGIPGAILGVASWHRGKEKRFRAGEPARPGVLATIMGGRRG